jgi:hypothetical protein
MISIRWNIGASKSQTRESLLSFSNSESKFIQCLKKLRDSGNSFIPTSRTLEPLEISEQNLV